MVECTLGSDRVSGATRSPGSITTTGLAPMVVCSQSKLLCSIEVDAPILEQHHGDTPGSPSQQGNSASRGSTDQGLKSEHSVIESRRRG